MAVVLSDRPFTPNTKYDIRGVDRYKNEQVHSGQQRHPSVSTYLEGASRPAWTLHKDNPSLPFLLCKGEDIGSILAEITFDLFSSIARQFLILILWTILVYCCKFLVSFIAVRCYVSLLLFSRCFRAKCVKSTVWGFFSGRRRLG